MDRQQFIQAMIELGFTEVFIGKVLDLREREMAEGVCRSWEEYLPDWWKPPVQ